MLPPGHGRFVDILAGPAIRIDWVQRSAHFDRSDRVFLRSGEKSIAHVCTISPSRRSHASCILGDGIWDTGARPLAPSRCQLCDQLWPTMPSHLPNASLSTFLRPPPPAGARRDAFLLHGARAAQQRAGIVPGGGADVAGPAVQRAAHGPAVARRRPQRRECTRRRSALVHVLSRASVSIYPSVESPHLPGWVYSSEFLFPSPPACRVAWTCSSCS